jgi:hypothetical protein
MTPNLIAIAIFCMVLSMLAILFAYYGRLSFWKLVQRHPFDGLAFFAEHDAWVITRQGEARPTGEYAGPFLFVEPSAGERLYLYAQQSRLEESQREFMESHAELVPRYMFPWLSALALLYPISAMKDYGGEPVAASAILGYGFSNLGYIMIAGAVLTKSFRILGLETRAQTLLGAAAFWIIGLVLSNI